MKKINTLLFIGVLTAAPVPAFALTMGEILPASNTVSLGNSSGEASAYIVIDKASGEVLLSKNPDINWTPASLTKLVTALVFMDSKTSLNKQITMTKQDEVGGSRLPTKTGVKYSARDLLHASLIASNNNATNALSRSLGLTQSDFVALMNRKAKSLGALNSNFVEPTGISPQNTTTARDFAKIVTAAFEDSYLSLVAKKDSYKFTSTNNKKYLHNIKSTNRLLGDSEIIMSGGKTGYLEESLYNLASVVKDRLGNEFIVVVLGAPNPEKQFSQAKQLALQATAIKVFGRQISQIAGTSTAPFGGN